MLTEKAKSLRETKHSRSVDSCDVAAPGYHIDAKSEMSLFPEAQRTVLLFFLIFGHCLCCQY